LVAANAELVREYVIGGSSTPVCTFRVTGQLKAMAANPVSGEVFYFVGGTTHKIFRLGPCNEGTGKFEEVQAPFKPSPEAKEVFALTVNPGLSWGPQRPAGVLYAIDNGPAGRESPSGDVFAPAKISPPEVLSESVANTTATSSTLQASINPRGFTTNYLFQYLTEEAYEANWPNERQSLTVGATGGVFGLGFRERGLGGAAIANLTSGSKVAEDLVTAEGTADIHAAEGTADLNGAVGRGAVIAGSTKVTVASTTEGLFAVGQTIVGKGIPAGSAITEISDSELTISVAATESKAGIVLNAGATTLTSLSTTEGEFEVGQAITGPGIPGSTTIQAVGPTELTLSNAVDALGTAVGISAGSTTLTGVIATEGAFEPGTPISGEGIPSGATVTAVHSGSLMISKAPTKRGSVVAISSAGPSPLAVGETVEGPGLPPGTKIVSAEAEKLTLSAAAEATTAGARLRVGLRFDAAAPEVQQALEALPTIGEGDITVSGGPGDGTGSTPYQVEFTGSLSNRNVSELEADPTGLHGGSGTVTVLTTHEGGGGFSSGASEVPVGGGKIAGGATATATGTVSGLSVDTDYRFRVVTTSECNGVGEPLCEADGESASFTTYPQAATILPDGRAYELVSPAQKSGGEVFPAAPRIGSCRECKPPGNSISVVFPMQSSPNGDAVAYMGYPFSPNEGASVFNSYVSHRSSGGWRTTAVSPMLLSTKGGHDLAFDDSLSLGTISQGSPQLAPSAPVGYGNLYLQNTSSPDSLTPIIASAPPNRSAGSFALGYAGHSPDFSAQFFTANDALTAASAFAPAPPDPGNSGRDLYEVSGGQLALVNVLSGNSAVASGSEFASSSPDAHPVSENGRRVFWHVGSTLYVRENGQITRQLAHGGSFLTASSDGLRVLFADGCLYSLLTEGCTDLTAGHGGFQGIAGQSESLSRIYFVDTAALPGSGKNSRNQEAEAGKANLYLYEAGSPTRFIATLLASDGNVSNQHGNLADWAAAPNERGAEASPDGRYLAFGSTAELTGQANAGPCEEVEVQTEQGTEHKIVRASCNEVFLYDSATGRLTCPSCNPAEEAPLGNSTLRRIEEEPPWEPQPRYLTDQGRLYFDSADRLSTQDTNGGIEDVYEAEPLGIGSCVQSDGCVSLISSGIGSVDSNFLAMDGNGGNVFFTTREQLVPKDTDRLIDLYDAREGGGFAAESEIAAGPCQGETCQSSPASSSAAPAPSTQSYQGPGNPKPTPHQACSKGKVKKGGKCVTKSSSKKKKAHKKQSNKKRVQADRDRGDNR
jgi:hypothetical protein